MTTLRQKRESRKYPCVRRVLLLAAPGAQILDVVGPFQVFMRAAELASQKTPNAPPEYAVEVVTTRGGLLETNCGLRLKSHGSYHNVKGAVDTVLVVGATTVEQGLVGPDAIAWLRQQAESARRIGSICTGAFLLAQAGLLNGKRAATHWKYCDLLARKYPQVKVEPDPIFIRQGKTYTSAGVTAGMDLALALVEEDLGPALALEVARELVLFLRRPGGQKQFSAALALQANERPPLRELGAWIVENLTKDLSVSALARQVAMSPRNFARVFSVEVGVTPGKFVESVRVEATRRRLECSNASLKEIAVQHGFTSCDSMRRVFERVVGVLPAQYRARFTVNSY